MTDEATLIEGAGEALPANDAAPSKAPRSDAEAALTETPDTPPAEPVAEAPKPDDGEVERKKNRTKEYIARINRENAELRQRAAELEARSKPAMVADKPSGEPSLEQHNYDIEAYQRALIEYTLAQRDTQNKQAESSRKQAEIAATYNQKVAEFADENPDFQEVVGSIAYPLSPALEAAIMAHPNGPQIAYHLGSNEDDAFALAAIQPHLADAAVQRLAARLTAAQPTPQATPTPTPKPVSKAPAPVPTVGGRSPVEIPPEKMTDDEWYARERKRREAKG